MMNRAYSILNVKTIDSERRILIGMATTPTPDRLGDVIEPMGVRFAYELPLLWQHDTKSRWTGAFRQAGLRTASPLRSTYPACADRRLRRPEGSHQ
jgi:hypothetical protein